MTTVHARLSRNAKRRPDSPFCTFLAGERKETITFGQLYRAGQAYARLLHGRGIGAGDIVLIILRHSPHLFYSFVGALLAGAVPSFMPFPSPKQRTGLYWSDHQTLFDLIEPRLIITYQENAAAAHAALPDLTVPIVVADDSILDEGGDEVFVEASPNDLACLQHSSGTTTLKKGVMLTHRAILDHVAAYSAALDFGPHDRIASWLPLYHDMGFIACFMTSLVEGTHLIALDPFEWTVRPHLILAAIEEYKATFCWLPNFAFSHIAARTRPDRTYDLSSIRAFINCSEPCKPHAFERFAGRFFSRLEELTKLQVCYAMAENVFAVTQTDLTRPVPVLICDGEAFARNEISVVQGEKPAVSVLSCGSAVDGVRVEVRNEEGQPLPPDLIGEVFVTGPFLFAGYYKLPERSRERLRDGWYATGDMGFMHGGELYVTGRIDDMIIVAGRNYYAHEIEAIVNEIPNVLPGRNVAIPVPDQNADTTAVAVLVECADSIGSGQLAHDIREEVMERLGLAVQSVAILGRGRLVKTTSGKISRTKNREMFLEGTL